MLTCDYNNSVFLTINFKWLPQAIILSGEPQASQAIDLGRMVRGAFRTREYMTIAMYFLLWENDMNNNTMKIVKNGGRYPISCRGS